MGFQLRALSSAKLLLLLLLVVYLWWSGFCSLEKVWSFTRHQYAIFNSGESLTGEVENRRRGKWNHPLISTNCLWRMPVLLIPSQQVRDLVGAGHPFNATESSLTTHLRGGEVDFWCVLLMMGAGSHGGHLELLLYFSNFFQFQFLLVLLLCSFILLLFRHLFFVCCIVTHRHTCMHLPPFQLDVF